MTASMLGPADSSEQDTSNLPPQKAPQAASVETDPAVLYSSSREELYAEVISLCRKNIVRADRILLLLQEGKSFEVKSSFGSKAVYVSTDETVSRSILRRVRRTQRAISIVDALADSDLAAQQSIKAIGQRSVLCAPVTITGKCVGVVYIDSISLVGAFTEEEFRWTIRLANSIARKLPTVKNVPAPRVPDAPKKVLQAPVASNRPAPSSSTGWGPQILELPAAIIPGRSPSLSDLTVFFRSLSCLLGAGLTLSNSVTVLSNSGSSMSEVATLLATDLNKGVPFSAALSRFPTLFSPDIRSLVAVGERSGTLDTVLDSIAQSVEKNWKIREKLKSALTYPAVIAVFCLLGIMLAPPLFLNDFFKSLQESNMELPLLSKVIMQTAKLIWHPLAWAGVGFAAVGASFYWKRINSLPRGRRLVENLVLRLPGLGDVYRKLRLLRFFRAFGLQLEAGLYLDRSLKLAAQVSGSDHFREEVDRAVERIHAGESLSFSLERSGLFDTTAVEFLKVGEETGKVAEMCRAVESLLTEETEHAIEVGQALVEPITMALLGALTGIVAIGCLLPLIRMIESLA